MSVDEQLAWERRRAPRAAVAAAIGGLGSLAAGLYGGLAFGDVPTSTFLRSLEHVAEPGALGSAQSYLTPVFQYRADHVGMFLLAAVLYALGTLGVGGALTYLAYATRARRSAMPAFVLYLPAVGAILTAVGTVLYAIARKTTADDFLAGPGTVDSVDDVTSSIGVAAQLIGFVGAFGLGIAYVFVCLNAMRAGLLTRFMGVLGILVGVLLVVPLLQGPPVVQSFWLLALAALFAGRWPKGVPPAWRSGKEEPWPTNAEMRAGRTGAAPAPKPKPEPVAAGAPAAAAPRPHPSSKKRKRKRRG